MHFLKLPEMLITVFSYRLKKTFANSDNYNPSYSIKQKKSVMVAALTL